jgi:uncharacterized protein YktA (UPF0223 family)
VYIFLDLVVILIFFEVQLLYGSDLNILFKFIMLGYKRFKKIVNLKQFQGENIDV